MARGNCLGALFLRGQVKAMAGQAACAGGLGGKRGASPWHGGCSEDSVICPPAGGAHEPACT